MQIRYSKEVIHSKYFYEVNTIKRCIFLFFLSLFLEGILRKWLLRDFANVLIFIREPLLLLVYFNYIRIRKLKYKPLIFYVLFCVLFILYGLFQIITSPPNSIINSINSLTSLFIFLYGYRCYLFYFPVAFIMLDILSFEDTIQYIRWMIWTVFPITLLMILQLANSPEHWLNFGSGEGTSQLLAALGKVRPSGPFSYHTGIRTYLPFVLAICLDRLTSPHLYKDELLTSATLISLILALLFSINRSLLAASILVFSVFIIIFVFRFKYLLSLNKFRYISIAIIIVLVAMFSSILFTMYGELLSTALSVFNSRIENASRVEGGLTGFINRAFDVINPYGSTVSSFVRSNDQDYYFLFGHGIGFGSNVASVLIQGRRSFILAEYELQRIYTELGLFGSLYYFGFYAYMIYLMFSRSLLCLRKRIFLPFFFSFLITLNLLVASLHITDQLSIITFMLGICLCLTKFCTLNSSKISEKSGQ